MLKTTIKVKWNSSMNYATIYNTTFSPILNFIIVSFSSLNVSASTVSATNNEEFPGNWPPENDLQLDLEILYNSDKYMFCFLRYKSKFWIAKGKLWETWKQGISGEFKFDQRFNHYQLIVCFNETMHF